MRLSCSLVLSPRPLCRRSLGRERRRRDQGQGGGDSQSQLQQPQLATLGRSSLEPWERSIYCRKTQRRMAARTRDGLDRTSEQEAPSSRRISDESRRTATLQFAISRRCGVGVVCHCGVPLEVHHTGASSSKAGQLELRPHHAPALSTYLINAARAALGQFGGGRTRHEAARDQSNQGGKSGSAAGGARQGPKLM